MYAHFCFTSVYTEKLSYLTIRLFSLLAEVSHDEAKRNERGETLSSRFSLSRCGRPLLAGKRLFRPAKKCDFVKKHVQSRADFWSGVIKGITMIKTSRIVRRSTIPKYLINSTLCWKCHKWNVLDSDISMVKSISAVNLTKMSKLQFKIYRK